VTGAHDAPIVRVSDASLIDEDGPVRVTVSRLAAPVEDVAEALAAARGRAPARARRLPAISTPSRLVDATGRAHGRPVAEALETRLGAALAARRSPPPAPGGGGAGAPPAPPPRAPG
jgi:hypothetical protein